MNRFKISAAVLALLPSAVFADDDAAAGADIIVTASGFEQPIDESGNAITLITRDELEQKQVAILSDIFREIPSISVASNGGVGQVSSAFIRGGNSAQSLVLIDGVEANSAEGGEYDFSGLIAADIERIEVLRGPQSSLFAQRRGELWQSSRWQY